MLRDNHLLHILVQEARAFKLQCAALCYSKDVIENKEGFVARKKTFRPTMTGSVFQNRGQSGAV